MILLSKIDRELVPENVEKFSMKLVDPGDCGCFAALQAGIFPLSVPDVSPRETLLL